MNAVYDWLVHLRNYVETTNARAMSVELEDGTTVTWDREAGAIVAAPDGLVRVSAKDMDAQKWLVADGSGAFGVPR